MTCIITDDSTALKVITSDPILTQQDETPNKCQLLW